MPIRERSDPYSSEQSPLAPAAAEPPIPAEAQPLTPQTPAAAPLPVLQPQAFAPQPEEFALEELPPPGSPIDPEAASVLFAPGGEDAPDPDAAQLEQLRGWYPVLLALGAQPDAPPFFQNLARLAEAILVEEGEIDGFDDDDFEDVD